ncbi:hypothetical protein KEU06_07595 [Pseudaminobacter sp. 19-2017]|uniref:Aldose 1-epimerase n=1 Tax=Pseudaminobacter soli (ex Zhang et al. 2022) TaxID=2831468 RepID=A0A942E0B1_9HYPH|nr:hypothetical protein [Pseudaminobacter soli]MBS3648490.1 hypothetical protein [Pseudaminobacter soli]
MRGEVWKITGRHGGAEVQSLGGMLGPAIFRLGDREVQPFVVAPWDEEDLPDRPGILRHLRGEWPCVPFGADASRPGLPSDWRSEAARVDAVHDEHPHGFSSNHHWHLVAHGGNSITIGIDYPEGHAIAGLERTIALSDAAPAIEFSLTIRARKACRTSFGFHPVYRLPVRPGSVLLELKPGARAWTFPMDVEHGRTVLKPDQRNAAPGMLLSAVGTKLDLSALPFPSEGEDLALLTGLDGSIALTYPDDGYVVTQEWDAPHLPSCLLWISAQGRRFPPWNGRFRGLGVEPIAAAFDLGPAASAGPNPLSGSGTATTIALSPDAPFVTRYRIACSALG